MNTAHTQNKNNISTGQVDLLFLNNYTFVISMQVLDKLRHLTTAGSFDSCGPNSCEVKIKSGLHGTYNAKSEHPNCKLLKVLQTNACSFDCTYCQNRSACTTKRLSLTPKELAHSFMHIAKKGGANSLFLSSGVAGDVDTAFSSMLETVKQTRKKGFHGYIHLKVLPGTSRHLIQEASEYVSRMSINIESPTNELLSEFSSVKHLANDILRRQAWIKGAKLSCGQSTQMILTKETTDKAVLSMMQRQYDILKLERIYFSAFQPMKHTPLESVPSVKKERAAKLYHVDALLRLYGFTSKDFYSIMDDGFLPHGDPKKHLFKEHYGSSISLSDATFTDLIRVPGIGLQGAKKILSEKNSLDTYSKLHRIGISKTAFSYLKLSNVSQTSLSDF